MFTAKGLRHYRVSDAGLGHLLYLVRSPPLLALRINYPRAGGGDDTIPGALILHAEDNGARVPFANNACANNMCVDLGVPPVLVWEHPLSVVDRRTEVTPDPGFLVLTGGKLALTTFPPRGERMYWDIAAGTLTDLDADFAFITRWKLGLTQLDGSFLTLAEYPKDYGLA